MDKLVGLYHIRQHCESANLHPIYSGYSGIALLL